MPRSGVGPLPRPGHPRLIRQPGATPLTKNKIKTQAKTAMNPHGSVVAVFDVAELVPVSVVVVAVWVVVAVVVSVVVSVVLSVVVLMVVVVLDVAELVAVSVVTMVPSNTYAEPDWAPTTTRAPSELTATE
ncbi:unnamed protein product [Prorocentrum cordatum]|uniref:Uncharacterized protein n=1 Tax=Prorocentrum cordatum TaxID=2364126 RepID=A0ABN9UKC1_9DINO|nr:unnamed protein product [Polarella glacialis]